MYEFTKVAFTGSKILWNIITTWNNCFLFEYILKCNFFLWCAAVFSASLLQSSVSHDPSEIINCWLAAQETFRFVWVSKKRFKLLAIKKNVLS